MNDSKTETPFDAEAFAKYMDEELPELLSGEGPWQHDGVMPDGSFCDWDEAMGITVETDPKGRRYVIELQNGEMVRVRELVNLAA